MANGITSDEHVVINERRRWKNKHETFSEKITHIYDVYNDTSQGDPFSVLKDTTQTLQHIIADAIADGATIRGLGGGWSMSKVAVTHGRLINLKPLNARFTISQASVSAHYQKSPEDLVFAQGGISIKELNDFLTARGRSLKTSGASNGQTITGAISTGTHGSDFNVGSTQDSVVALHLIVGPDRHVWLEAESYPVMSDSFIDNLGAELIRDDTLFNAALVSFGSYGIIHAVVLESDPLFLLEAHRTRLPFDDAMRHTIRSLDFSRVQLPRDGEQPHHFAVVLNPYDLEAGARVTTMYKRPLSDDFEPPVTDPDGINLGDDALGFIGLITDGNPNLIPLLVRTILNNFYADYSDKLGRLGDIFASTSIRGKSTGSAIGVPLEETERALDAILTLFDVEEPPFAGVIALRYVKKSDALMAFTRFETTCVIDLDGVHSRRTNKFYQAAWKKLEDEGIPFTLHWGKVNDAKTVDRIKAIDEAAVQDWVSKRIEIMDETTRQVFSNAFMEANGLNNP